MSHFGDFMDDVPVKISENYKRHTRIDLPYTVNECITRAQKVVDCANATHNYSCSFEKNVLLKLKELRTAKETKKNERRHRLQLRQEAEQKRLDAIARAEEEERLKQLNVSEVSYPSTEEISVLSPDEKPNTDCDNNTSLQNNPEMVEVTCETISLPSARGNTDTDLNILQPIQVKTQYQENSLLDDPDPLQNLKINITKIPHNPNIDSLTFRDFENDTSSPFDNVELKTINDMELLAQVLQSHKATSVSSQQLSYAEQGVVYTPVGSTQVQTDENSYIPANYTEQPIQGSNMIYNSPQNYPMSNGCYMPSDAENLNMYVPNYQYYVPPNPYPNMDTYYGGQLPGTSDINQTPNGSPYIPQPYYYHYPHVALPYSPPNVSTCNPPVQHETTNTDQNSGTTSQYTVKSRSRSVPDIVRELNEELEKLRTNERSYNASPAPKNIPQPPQQQLPSTSNNKKEEQINKRKMQHLPNPFNKLPIKSQEMCKNIHGMGFPLDRVARVCSLVGDNDKKIIECLLIVGELMDLGFMEDKVSAALVKHQFNRDKALDELVS